MGFSLGLVGLPNSGKTTIFNALTALNADAHPYPFCTIDPNVGIVPVPDERLAKLASILRPEKVTPTTIEFVDVAGLIKDAHKGEGLGNRFLSHVRAVDAFAHVIRCFLGDVPHIYENIDPRRDLEIVEAEIVISDLEIVEERLKKIERLSKVSKDDYEKEKKTLLKVRSILEGGRFPSNNISDDEERKILEALNLITIKPFFLIANIDERDLGKVPFKELEMIAKEKRSRIAYICGKLEKELSELSAEERQIYMEQYGMERMGIEEVIKIGYEILDLITFYTIVGKEIRAWTVKRNTTCLKAAGKIHSDMEKGFIKAEVINFDEFVKIGSESAAREKGILRIEGRDYLVKDGDILHIRFSQ